MLWARSISALRKDWRRVLSGRALLIAVVMATGAAASAQPPPEGVRGAVEISLVSQPNGAPSFGVPLLVGGQLVVAGLDTGSSGLRLLPSAQHGLSPTGDPIERTYSYASGVSMIGPEAMADVAFDTVRGQIKVQQINRVGCTHPDAPCKVGARPIDQYGFFSGKQPNRGFKAILGAMPNPQGNIINPWIELGVRRWILSLPRPGDRSPGRLILNPTPADMVGFRPVPSGVKPWQLATCIERGGPQPKRVCGTDFLDSGAAGQFQLVNAEKDGGWKPGTPLVIDIGNGADDDIRFRVRLGDERQGLEFFIGQNAKHPGITVLSGAAVYYACDVMWDADRQQILLRLRPPYSGGGVPIGNAE